MTHPKVKAAKKLPKLSKPVRLWIAALRSGKYKPAKWLLQDGEGYCCLGVACVVAEKQGVNVMRDYDGEILGGSLEDQPYVQNWLGLSSDQGDFDDEKLTKRTKANSLAGINDDAKKNPFKRIADIIESRPEGLFS